MSQVDKLLFLVPGTLFGRKTNVCSRTSHCHDADETERDRWSISEDKSC